MTDKKPEKESNEFKLEVSKVGTFTPTSGKPVTITTDMLQELAETYDPEISKAPFVLGHPKIDDPAYGWGDRMLFENDKLYMLGNRDKINAGFKEKIENGEYKKVSLAWYEPDAPNNPTPGKRYAKQVGCLGGKDPAVPLDSKGLEVLTENYFSAGSEEGVIECSYAVNTVIPGLFRSLREWIIDKFDLETADKVIPDWEIKTVEEEGMRKHAEQMAATAEATPSFSANDEDIMTQEEIDAIVAENERLKATNATLETTVGQFQEKDSANRAEEIQAFCNGMVDNKRMMPEVARQLSEVLTALEPAEGEGVFAFSDGTDQPTLTKAVMGVVKNALDFNFDFDEKGHDDTGAAGKGVKAFSAPAGSTVSQDKVEQLAKAKQIVADSGNTITLLDAVKQVEQG